MFWLQIFIITAKQATFSEDIKFLTNHKLVKNFDYGMEYLIVCRLPKPNSDITLSFFKNLIANSRINLLSRIILPFWDWNLLSRDRIYYLEIQFTKSRSNLLSRDGNLLSPDWICYLEIEVTISRSNLLSRDRICYLEIKIS